MKKTVLCVIFAIILCSSCQSAGLEKKYTVPGSVPDTSAKQPDIPETDNFTDYNDLITKTDDIHYIAENFFSSNIYGSGSISDIAGTVGIKCLRETGNGKKPNCFSKSIRTIIFSIRRTPKVRRLTAVKYLTLTE